MERNFVSRRHRKSAHWLLEHKLINALLRTEPYNYLLFISITNAWKPRELRDSLILGEGQNAEAADVTGKCDRQSRGLGHALIPRDANNEARIPILKERSGNSKYHPRMLEGHAEHT